MKGKRLRDDLGGGGGAGRGGGGGADLQVKRAGTLGPLWPFCRAPRPDGLLKSFGADKGNTAGVNTLPGGFHRSNELIWQIGEELVLAGDGQRAVATSSDAARVKLHFSAAPRERRFL